MADDVNTDECSSCYICLQEFNSDDKILKCSNVCSKSVHQACTQFKSTELKLIEKNSSIKWFCNSCIDKEAKLEEIVLSKFNTLYNAFNNCMKEIDVMKSQLTAQNMLIENLTSEIKSYKNKQETPADSVQATTSNAEQTNKNIEKSVTDYKSRLRKHSASQNVQNIDRSKQVKLSSTSDTQMAPDVPNAKVNTAKTENTSNINLKPKSDESDFQVVKPRRKRNKLFGTAANDDDNASFTGIAKKLWLFISRVNMNVTAKDISKYLVSKTKKSEDEFTVSEIPDTNKSTTKRFKISASFDLKDDLYSPSFWPKGVAYGRFNFNVERKNHINNVNFTSLAPNTSRL